jgi:hypothetical protein
MHKVAMNKTRLSNVVDNNIESGEPLGQNRRTTGLFRKGASSRSILRKRRKLQLNLQYDDHEDMELTQVGHSRDMFRQSEPNWTMQEFGDLVYLGQRKRVELVRWCSLLSERGRAERIDIIARLDFLVN